LQGKPYDGHGTVIPEIEKQIGVPVKRIFCDAGDKATTRQKAIASRPPGSGAG